MSVSVMGLGIWGGVAVVCSLFVGRRNRSDAALMAVIGTALCGAAALIHHTNFPLG